MELTNIKRVRTLGPSGTNCESAAQAWINSRNLNAEVFLHETLEEAMGIVIQEEGSLLLGCAVYPDLHNLVFPYLGKMKFIDSFVFNTFNMVFAKRSGNKRYNIIATHPAPQFLVSDKYKIHLANSNSEAASLCAKKQVDACITTLPAAKAHNLEVVEDFGEVPMIFTIQAKI